MMYLPKLGPSAMKWIFHDYLRPNFPQVRRREQVTKNNSSEPYFAPMEKSNL